MAYERPQVTVDQNMTITPTSIERDQPAFVFGPNYELHRAANAEEKPKTAIGTFEGSEMKVRYPGAIDDEKVDAGYTKLTGDNVVVQLAELGAAELPEKSVDVAKRAENGGYTKLLFANKIYVDRDVDGASVTRDASLPRNLAAGDLILISYKEGASAPVNQIRTKIVDVRYSASGWNIDSDSSYEGVAGTLVTVEDAIPETVDPKSVSDAKLVCVLQNVEFTSKNIKEQSGYQWEQGQYTVDGETFRGVKVNALNALVTGYFAEDEYCTVLFADLFVTFRELLTAYADTFHSVLGSAEVENMLGTVDPDNPLAMGVYMAAINAATDDGDSATPIYFMAVPTDDKKGYDAVLNKATLTDRAYVFAPTTRDEGVLEAVRSHVLEMSTKTVKMWRIAAASAEVPEIVSRLNAALDPQGDDFLAIPVSDAGTTPGLAAYNKFRVVKSVSDINGNPDVKFRSTIVADDVVRFCYRTDPWGVEKFDEYTIKRVVNNYTVEIDTKDGMIDVSNLSSQDTSYKPVKVEIVHAYTAAELADEIAKTSKQMASRRMLNVFPSVFKNDGVLMTGEFAACAIAGLISATEPQQPITNVTVRGIDDIPMAYQTFNKAQLDTIAAGGTFIIAQDLPGDLVYVRHQITTAYPDGNLNTAELSITKNVDSISYAFAEVFRPYYGKFNITPELIAIFETLAGQLISQFGGSTSVYGPQLITENTTIKYIRQNELLKDHVDIAISLGVPYPCNNIDIVLTV